MSWIKRNLFFVIGGTVAVLLLAAAGFYLYSGANVNTEYSTKLEAAYSELTRIANLQPNPGNEKVDNAAVAREHRAKVLAKIDESRAFFTPIPTIPLIPTNSSVSAVDYSAALRRTVDEMTRNAANASVILQPKYYFSFLAQQPLVKFAAGSLEPLAAQLGDIKAICDVLFNAKINTLYNLRRPRVSDDDLKGPQSDYLSTTSVTNELAVLVPYEVTFYGFSDELAAVLTGFANEPHGFIVTTMNVEPGTPGSTSTDAAGMAANNNAAIMAARLGYAAPAAAAPGAARGGLPVMLDQQQLKVTMGVTVVKLLPKK